MDHESLDASTTCRFRNHLEERGLLAKLLNMINQQLERHGILVRTGSLVDAPLIPSARKPRKVEEVIADEQDDEDDDDKNHGQRARHSVETSYSDDTEARWAKKGKVYCYGYKGHMAVDVGDGFIMGGHVTAANRPDCLELMNVVGESGLEDGAPVFADKGYASAENRCDLEDAGYFDGIMYKGARNHPLGWAEKTVNRAIATVRGAVERAFGSMKKHYGLERAREVPPVCWTPRKARIRCKEVFHGRSSSEFQPGVQTGGGAPGHGRWPELGAGVPGPGGPGKRFGSVEEAAGRRPRGSLPRQGAPEVPGRGIAAIEAIKRDIAPGARHPKKAVGIFSRAPQ
jgi:IS5 family transposase